MENILNITQAQYQKHPITEENCGIIAIINGVRTIVPFDYANTTYAEIMRQVEAGTLTIADAE